MEPTDFQITHPYALLALIVLLPAVAYFVAATFDPMKRTRKALVMAARLLVVTAVIAALSDIRWQRETPEKKLCVLALIDLSRSIPDAALDQATAKLESLFAGADENHCVGLIGFAGQAQLLHKPQTTAVDLQTIKDEIKKARADSDLDPGESNVVMAMDLSLSVFPPGFGRRIVLLSDGNETIGEAQTKISRLSASGIDVHTMLLSSQNAPFDLAVSSITVPTSVQPKISFDVKARISASAPASATATLYRNGYVLERKAVELKPGTNDCVYRQQLDNTGQYLYRVHLSCDQQQAKSENDDAFAFTSLRRKPKLLIVGESESHAAKLTAALKQVQMECEFRTPDGAPDRMTDLLDFDAVILNNLQATSVPPEKQSLLRDYVDIFAGGLLSIGLDNVSGWAGTPVEDALPVTCNYAKLPNVSNSVVVVADTSFSVVIADQDEATGKKDAAAPKLSRPEIVRMTASNILSLLSERDYFGLINFGSEAYAPSWIVRTQKVYDRKKLDETIEVGLQTKPNISDPELLKRLVDKEADPEVNMPAKDMVVAIEGLLDPNRRPHLDPPKLIEFVRKRLKARNQQINPNVFAHQVERLIRPNAFLARSNVFRSLIRAARELQQRETARKRIVLISDGYFEGDYDYARIAGQLASDGISISTIALKDKDAYLTMLEDIAKWGVGLPYKSSADKSTMEQLKQAMNSLQAPRIMEMPFCARKLADSPLLRGIDVSLSPPLFGYVRTTAKLGAQTLLGVPPDYEPLLATWNYGAGKTACFTSDAYGRWSGLWLRDWKQGYDQLWHSTVEALCARSMTRRIAPQIDVKGKTIDVAIDLTDEHNGFVNGDEVTARFYYLGEEGYIFSRTMMEERALTQTAPGRYETSYQGSEKGIYIVRLSARNRDSANTDDSVYSTGAIVSLSAEDAALAPDAERVKAWATSDKMGGDGKSDADVSHWLDVAGKVKHDTADLSSWAAAAAAIFFAFDVLLRRWPGLVNFVKRRLGREAA
jgi:uncharacterized membrane protein